jgi:hypothetical protein
MRSFKFFFTIAMCAWVFLHAAAVPAHNLKGDPTAIDLLVQHTDAAAWNSGLFSQTKISEAGTSAAIVLKMDGITTVPVRGYYESAPISVGFLFHEILPSWNIETPPKTGYAVELAVKNEKSAWSPWYYVIGDNTAFDSSFRKVRKDDHGAIDVDYWVGAPVKYVKYRVWLFSLDGKSSPELKRFFLALRGSRKNNPRFKNTADKARATSLPKKFNTPAPFKWQSQLARRALWGQICCPTAATMVLGAFGHDVDTTTVVNMCYDPEEEIYGVWPRASQTISQFGLVSYVTRFRNLDEVRRQLAQGTPIMASIQAKKGELPEAIYSSTGGHLILITGYDGSDWFIVNDPASRNRAKCFQVKYSAGGIQKAWIDNGGVGIIAFPEKQ